MSKSPLQILMLMFLVASLGSAYGAKPAEAKNFDVVVYGATAAGVAAAYSAAHEGAKVALVEQTRHIGGMVTGGLGRTDTANKNCIGGFARDFYKRLGKFYGKPIEWYPEPHVAEKVLNQMLSEAKVNVFLGQRLVEHGAVASESGRIKTITMENGSKFSAKVFADCSYEGDLMAQAGVSYTFGREGESKYGESLAGVRAVTKNHQFNVDVKARDKDGKLLPEIQGTGMAKPGSADKKVQAYNYRLCMTKLKDNQAPFPKPPGYDPARYELLARLLKATTDKDGKPPKAKSLMHLSPIQNGKTDTNNKGAFSTDYIGGSWGYPEATYAERDKITQEHYKYVAGFFYFLTHDDQVPSSLRDEMTQWALAADEFIDTDHWPRQLYVREARRMIGEYVMTQADIQTSRTKDDVIGMGSYNSDSHNVQRFENSRGMAENEGNMEVKVKPYQIPYRMIAPRKSQIQNLLVPVCFSASHVAYSTLRMEPQYMIIGQAAGIAARMAVKNDSPVQDIDTAALTARLAELNAVLTLDSDK